MKRTIALYTLLFMGAATLASCEKDALKLSPVTQVEDKAFLRVMYYSPNPNVNNILKLDTTKVGTTFFYSQVNPSDGSAYHAIDPGNRQGSFVIPKAGTGIDSLVLKTFSSNFEKGKYYSLFVADTLSTIKTFIVEDDLTLPEEGKAKIRFAHMMYNVPAMDVRLSDGTVVVPNLTFGTVTPFIELNAAQLYALRFTTPGTNTQLPNTPAAFTLNLTPTTKRIYTTVLRGVATNPASTTPPIVTLLTNR